MENANRYSAPPLRIAMGAPPWFDIPPRVYGGIEWMCCWLTEGLVARGHDVTFFAAGNDNTSAQFVQTFADPPSDRLGEALPDVLHAMAARRVIDTLDPDIVPDHTVREHRSSRSGPLRTRGVEHDVTGFVYDDPRQLVEGIERAIASTPKCVVST